ncbi:MAG: hypothetical protein F8N36_14515 [Desulfovibrio sp.]|nr:hypothetical protein [Desulfovibrio sp.]
MAAVLALCLFGGRWFDPVEQTYLLVWTLCVSVAILVVLASLGWPAMRNDGRAPVAIISVQSKRTAVFGFTGLVVGLMMPLVVPHGEPWMSAEIAMGWCGGFIALGAFVVPWALILSARFFFPFKSPKNK